VTKVGLKSRVVQVYGAFFAPMPQKLACYRQYSSLA